MLSCHGLVLTVQLVFQLIKALIFTDCDVFHFRSDDSLFCIIQLRNIHPCFRTKWLTDVLKTQFIQLFVILALFPVIRTHICQFFYISAI
ncbi:hypothetical protein D3C86_1786250 [compost metagenome]